MEFKIDTKEKFTTITPSDSLISDNMTADLKKTCLGFLNNQIKNIVLDMHQIKSIDVGIAHAIADLQNTFYENNASFVICKVQPFVNKLFEEEELDGFLNQTPTESEAWDIVQMEEIERELLDGDDISFENNE
jgi:anti-anti-sigma regulatory factor